MHTAITVACPLQKTLDLQVLLTITRWCHLPSNQACGNRLYIFRLFSMCVCDNQAYAQKCTGVHLYKSYSTKNINIK